MQPKGRLIRARRDEIDYSAFFTNAKHELVDPMKSSNATGLRCHCTTNRLRRHSTHLEPVLPYFMQDFESSWKPSTTAAFISLRAEPLTFTRRRARQPSIPLAVQRPCSAAFASSLEQPFPPHSEDLVHLPGGKTPSPV